MRKQYDANGEAIKGDREINKEGIPCPSCKTGEQSAINGNRKHCTGIFNNELYIGRLIWNRQRFIKDPMTGKRVTRLNDKSEWGIQEVSEISIVPQELWETAKQRENILDRKKPALW